MRIHHLNCGTMCPYGGRWWDGITKGMGPARLVCHCLLVEAPSGLVLVDTGFGSKDVSQPRSRISEFFLRLDRPVFNLEETALKQIQRMGFKPEDVRHIVLTHLDFDHAGGIDDFPNATVHLLAREYEAALHVRNLMDIARYRPPQWRRPSQWLKYEPGGETWFGFDGVREMTGLPPEILLVPLVGHTRGHCGVAIRQDSGKWLLHAGDAYFYREEMNTARPRCTPGLRAYQRMMDVDHEARIWNQGRLRELLRQQGKNVRIVSAHDRLELEWALRDSRAAERTARDAESIETLEAEARLDRRPVAPPSVSPVRHRQSEPPASPSVPE
jgi:glyoxylase-like metal-dependent hydrolase (beta-lactamase superfamily II)